MIKIVIHTVQGNIEKIESDGGNDIQVVMAEWDGGCEEFNEFVVEKVDAALTDGEWSPESKKALGING